MVKVGEALSDGRLAYWRPQNIDKNTQLQNIDHHAQSMQKTKTLFIFVIRCFIDGGCKNELRDRKENSA